MVTTCLLDLLLYCIVFVEQLTRPCAYFTKLCSATQKTGFTARYLVD